MKKIYLDEVPSTNAEAWNFYQGQLAGRTDTFEPMAFIAQTQTQGRGRQGRAWLSFQKGNLYVSFLLPGMDANIHWIPLATGIATIEAIPSQEVRLKWPNDIYFKDKKVGGILCESRFQGQKCQALVLGIGLNVKNHPQLKDPDTNIQSGCLADFISDVSLDFLLKKIEENLTKTLALVTESQITALQTQWKHWAKLDHFSELKTHGKNNEILKYKIKDLTKNAELEVVDLQTNRTAYLNQAF